MERSEGGSPGCEARLTADGERRGHEHHVVQRDPARVQRAISDVQAEITRRLDRGHVLEGRSLEAETVWLAQDTATPDRAALVAAAAGLIEAIALWDWSREAPAEKSQEQETAASPKPRRPYGDPDDWSDVWAIWGALRDGRCPGWKACPRWIAGGGCCGEEGRKAVQEWKDGN